MLIDWVGSFEPLRRDRWYFTIFGIIFLLIAVYAFTVGDRQNASMCFIIGAAVVIGNEWWSWRGRQ